MKNFKLLIVALALLGIKQVHGWCENEPNFLSIVSNKSAYPVIITDAHVEEVPFKTEMPRNYGTSKPITRNGITIQQKVTGLDGRGYNKDTYFLQDTSEGLLITHDGNSLSLGTAGVRGCNMYIEIYYNADDTAGIRVRAGGLYNADGTGKEIATTGTIK